MSALQNKLDRLLEELAPSVEKQFRAAIEDIQSGVVISAVTERLEAGDVSGAMELLNIEEDSFSIFYESLRNAVVLVGALVATDVPRLKNPQGRTVVFRFNPQNNALMNWFDTNTRSLVSTFLNTINQNARNVIASGILSGRSPELMVYDIVGRLNKQTGKRDGSILGMTTPNTDTVMKVQTGLLRGEPEEMKHYLKLKRRDTRYDNLVNKAIAGEYKLTSDDIAIMMTLLKQSYYNLRTEAVVETSLKVVSSTTKDNVYRQSIAKALLTQTDIERVWRSMADEDVRHTHRLLNGQTKDGFDDPFQSTSGALMRFAGDTSYGAGANEISFCRCHTEYRYKNLKWV